MIDSAGINAEEFDRVGTYRLVYLMGLDSMGFQPDRASRPALDFRLK